MSSDGIAVEEMSRTELETLAEEQHERLDELEEQVNRLESETVSTQTLNVLLRHLTGEEIHPNENPYDHLQKASELREAVEDVDDRVERHDDRLGQLESDSRHAGKSKKVRDIVEFATNMADAGQHSVFLTPKEIQGAAGVTRRYAYDLVDELPEEYSFILNRDEVQQYGSLEIDHDKRSKGVVVVVEEGVHDELDGVNLFTTRNSRMGGEE